MHAAVDSDKEVVYFYDMDENAINSVGADGTNMKPFVVNGNITAVSFSGVRSSTKSEHVGLLPNYALIYS